MAKIGDLLFGIKGDWNQFEAEITKRGAKAGEKTSDSLAASLKKNQTKIASVVGGAIGVGFASAVKPAAEFEDQLRTINTVAKMTDEQLFSMGDQIQALARETGKSTTELTSGFYDLVSAGVPADKAMAALKSSAILATGALGTTGEAVSLVTAALGSYGMDASQAGKVTDIFAQAVADGATTVAELSSSIGSVAPIAASAGIELEEIAANVGLVTLSGASASEAMTQMRAAISGLLTPNVQLAAVSREVGINFAELAREKGLAVALDELRRATGGSDEAFAKALGSTEALTFALQVTGPNADKAAAALGRVEVAATEGGVALGQYTEKSKSSVEQGKRLTQTMATLVQDIGAIGAPIAPAIMGLGQLGQALSGLTSAASLVGVQKLAGPLVTAFKAIMVDAGILSAAAAAGTAQGAAMAGGETAGGMLGTFKGKLTSALPLIMKAAGVIGLAAMAAEMEEPAAAVANDLNATIFGKLEENNAQGGSLGGTIFDSVLDGIHGAADAASNFYIWPPGGPPGAAAQGAAVGEAFGSGILSAPWMGNVTTAAETGMSAAGVASAVAFSDTFRDLMQQRMDAPARAAAALAGQSFSAELYGRLAADQQLAAAGANAASLFATSFETRLAGADVRAREIGGDIGGSVAKGLADSSTQVVTATEALKYVLEHGLTPQQQRTQALGAAWGKLFTQGVNSSKPGAKEAAFTMGVEGLQALSRGSNPPGSAGAKRIAMIAANLYRDGWTTQQVEAALAAQGVGTASLTKLRGVKGFDTAGEGHGKQYAVNLDARPNIIAAQRAALALANAPRSTLSGLDWSAYGSRVGMTWGNGIDSPAAMAAARRAANNLADAAGRYLSGRSPPPEGPLRHIDIGGRNVARAWIGGLDDELRRGARRLDSALSTYQMADLSGGLHTMGATATMDQTLTVRLEVDGTNLPPGVTNAGIATATTQALDMAGFLRSKRTAVTLPVTRR